MIKTSDHGQIFLDYVIEHHRLYLDISYSEKKPLTNELSANWFLSKRNPKLNELFSDIRGLNFLNVPIPMTMFQILIDSI